MSRKSLNNKHYLKYQKQIDAFGPVEFPENRDPNTDMFGDDTMRELNRYLKLNDPDTLASLKGDLRELARVYFSLDLLSHLLPGQKRSKLTNDVKIRKIRAATKCVESLTTLLNRDGRALIFPLLDTTEKLPNIDNVAEDLASFKSYLDELMAGLQDRITDRANNATEFKLDFLSSLETVLSDHARNLVLKRDGWDKTREEKSLYVQTMTICAEEIFPGGQIVSGKLLDDLAG